jgi:hypothetical protein
MHFHMDSNERLYVAVHRLRAAGYAEAARGDARVGSPYLLSVPVDDVSEPLVQAIVVEVDPRSRPLD